MDHYLSYGWLITMIDQLDAEFGGRVNGIIDTINYWSYHPIFNQLVMDIS